MPRARVILPVLALAAFFGGPAGAADEHVIVPGDKIAWQPVPKALPPGAQAAVLAGNPEARDGFYVIRILMPDGYMVPPHSHSKVENVTVLSGNFKVGMGKTADPAGAQTLGPGGFFSAAANTPHYASAAGPTMIEVSGMSPFDITYVNAKDDPRAMTGSSQ